MNIELPFLFFIDIVLRTFIYITLKKRVVVLTTGGQAPIETDYIVIFVQPFGNVHKQLFKKIVVRLLFELESSHIEEILLKLGWQVFT